MTTMRLAILSLLTAAACARDVSPAATTKTDAPSQAQHQAAGAPGEHVAHASHAGEGEHAGCIYAGTEADGHGACPGGGQEPDAPKASTGHFGAPFRVAASVPLHEAIGKAAADTVLVSGTVEAVCQKKGCWMVVKDGNDTARVMMKDHAFAVPIDSRGKPVLVEGTLTKRTFDEAQVKHLEQDKGGDPSKVAGPRDEHVLMATGVEIKS